MTRAGYLAGAPNISESGTVRPCSTSVLFAMVTSNASRISDWAVCQPRSGAPSTIGTGRAPVFTRRLELRRASQCEGRNQIEAEGGRMIVPVGNGIDQQLFLLEKKDGQVAERAILPVRFVQMTGEAATKK